MLSPEQIEHFRMQGYLVLDPCLEAGQVEALTERVRQIAEGEIDLPDGSIEYEPGATGRRMESLRKINFPSRYDPFFVDHARHSRLLDPIVDLIGPDVKLFGDQLFMKPPGGIEKTYHQDCPYFSIEPMAMVSAWVALDDVTEDNGCIYVVPGSHKLGFFDHYDDHGQWAGRVSDTDLESVPVGDALSLTGPAGSVTVIHSGILHHSRPNHSDRWRPLLICGYASADAFPFVPHYSIGTRSKYAFQMARGEPAKYAHLESLRLRIPPDWSRGYHSIFEDQKGERRSA